MPFYDLYCIKCDKEHNIYASVKEKIEKSIPCPDCGSFDLETVFKGTPAYVKNTKMQECPNSHICGGGCRHVS